jgi:hypothetical protein
MQLLLPEGSLNLSCFSSARAGPALRGVLGCACLPNWFVVSPYTAQLALAVRASSGIIRGFIGLVSSG